VYLLSHKGNRCTIPFYDLADGKVPVSIHVCDIVFHFITSPAGLKPDGMYLSFGVFAKISPMTGLPLEVIARDDVSTQIAAGT
jgi:hypothetical protein